MSVRAAQAWLRIALVADLILATLAWVFVIGFMRAPFWTPEPQQHSWGEYLRATVEVFGGGLAVTAMVTVAGRWLVGHGRHLPGVLVAALPLEAAFLFVASNLSL